MKNRAKGTRIKNPQSHRTVPLHPSIADEVLAYREKVVQQYGDGPLFPMLPTDDQNRRGSSGGTKIRRWIRNDLGISDKDIAPMHGFRHYVRTQLYLNEVDDKTKNSITGHSDGGKVSLRYEHVPNAKKAKALALLPDPLAMAR